MIFFQMIDCMLLYVIVDIVDLLLGCHMGHVNFILGGSMGYSWGKVRVAVKAPPSYSVSSGPMMTASQIKQLLSSMGPAATPGGGSSVILLYSCLSLLIATPQLLRFISHGSLLGDNDVDDRETNKQTKNMFNRKEERKIISQISLHFFFQKIMCKKGAFFQYMTSSFFKLLKLEQVLRFIVL